MLLEPIYEEDFLGLLRTASGLRRSAHQALETLWQATSGGTGGWVLEVDIRKFFDTLEHAHFGSFSNVGYVTGYFCD